MDIEGKYTLPNGEVLEVHVNIAVNTWKNGEWRSFNELSESEFWLCMKEMEKQGVITFEPTQTADKPEI